MNDYNVTLRMQMYKSRGILPGGEAAPAAKAQRVENLNIQRRESRWSEMLKRRNISAKTMSPIFSPCSSNRKSARNTQQTTKGTTIIIDKRLEMLKKWQHTKKQQKEKQKARAKPVFKVQHVTATSSYDLSRIYTEIKGKPIGASSTYKFKPPANIKPVTSSTAGSTNKQKLPLTTNKVCLHTHNTRQRKTADPFRNQQAKKPVTSNFKTSLKPTSPVVYKSKNGRRGSQQHTTSKISRQLKPIDIKKPETSNSETSSSLTSPVVNKSKNGRRVSQRPTTSKLSPDEKSIAHKKPATSTSETTLSPTSPVVNKSKNGRRVSQRHNTSKLSRELKSIDNKKPETSNSETSSSPVVNKSKNNRRASQRHRFTRQRTVLTTSQEVQGQLDKKSAEVPDTDDEVFLPLETKSKKVRKSKSSQSATSSSRWTDDQTEANATTSDSIDSNQPLTPLVKNLPSNVTYVSPFVTMSRGKDNARKEYHRRSVLGGSEKAQSPSSKNDELKSTSPKAAATYFSKLLMNQTVRLQMLCEEWNLYKGQQNPAEEICDMINVAIGQTELLIRKKFNLFKELIDRCESGNSVQPVKCLDLHGFWDTVMMQVNNLDQRFDNLERLKRNNWEEILPLPQAKKKGRSKKATSKQKQASSSSSLRAAIQEARKRKATVEQNSVGMEHISLPSISVTSILTPLKTPKCATRSSLRVSVLTVGNQRNSSPGLAMMKVTQMAKSTEKSNYSTPLEAPRSILKPVQTQSVSRQPKVVLFKDTEFSQEDKENDFINLIDFGSPNTVDKTPVRRSSRLGNKPN